MIQRLIDWATDALGDEVTTRLEQGRERIEVLDLSQGEPFDVEAHHAEIQPGDIAKLGLDDPDDCAAIYLRDEGRWHVHEMKIAGSKAIGHRARVAGHTHKRGNFERVQVVRGVVTLLWGEALENRTTLYAGDEKTLDGSIRHAFLGHEREADLTVRIERK